MTATLPTTTRNQTLWNAVLRAKAGKNCSWAGERAYYRAVNAYECSMGHEVPVIFYEDGTDTAPAPLKWEQAVGWSFELPNGVWECEELDSRPVGTFTFVRRSA